MELLGKIVVIGWLIFISIACLFGLYKFIWGYILKKPVKKCLIPICKEAEGYEVIRR